MHRKEILEAAIAHTCGERDVEYGSPGKNLSDIAVLWEAYLCSKYTGIRITAEDVAWLNVLQKIARTYKGGCGIDTYEDAAAYSAIAGEVATDGVEPKMSLDKPIKTW